MVVCSVLFAVISSRPCSGTKKKINTRFIQHLKKCFQTAMKCKVFTTSSLWLSSVKNASPLVEENKSCNHDHCENKKIAIAII